MESFACRRCWATTSPETPTFTVGPTYVLGRPRLGELAGLRPTIIVNSLVARNVTVYDLIT